MKSISDIFKIFGERIKKILWFLGLHAFALILFLIFTGFILGGFIFYKYVFLAEKEASVGAENILKFDEKSYQDVLKELQAREESNEEPATASPTNPLLPPQNNPAQ
ncbi:MAG: hypothetical protein NTY81_03265 [Candidatus Staskawiczbacteria bacterium]|nr:hypothetical protein [Candidatus Staskawiczbacteria bacterium]